MARMLLSNQAIKRSAPLFTKTIIPLYLWCSIRYAYRVQGLVTTIKGKQMMKKSSVTRRLLPTEEDAFFEQFGGIVFGVCKKIHLSPAHPDFDDFIQQGYLKLVEAYECYPYPIEQPNNLHISFVSFAYQKIYWHFMDNMRKAQKRKERECFMPEEPVSLNGYSSTDLFFFEENELFQNMLGCLTSVEQQLLLDLVFEGLSTLEAAKKYGVSRKTIYERRKKIRYKLLPFYSEIQMKS